MASDDLSAAQLHVMRLYYRLVRIEQTLEDAGGPALVLEDLPTARRIVAATVAKDFTPRGNVGELQAEAARLENHFAEMQKVLEPEITAADGQRVALRIRETLRMARLDKGPHKSGMRRPLRG